MLVFAVTSLWIIKKGEKEILQSPLCGLSRKGGRKYCSHLSVDSHGEQLSRKGGRKKAVIVVNR